MRLKAFTRNGCTNLIGAKVSMQQITMVIKLVSWLVSRRKKKRTKRKTTTKKKATAKK